MNVPCPKCRLVARVDTDETVLVICPRAGCGHRFLALPPQFSGLVKAEVRETPFRCATTGGKFWVVFGRLHRSEKFSVRNIHTDAGWSERTRKQQAAALANTVTPSTAAPGTTLPAVRGSNLPAVTDPSVRSGGVLAILRQAFRESPPAPASGAVEAGWRRLNADELMRECGGTQLSDDGFDLAEFDLTDWRCAHCPSPHAGFVRCGRCREYVCKGRSDIRGADWLFRCHDGCGVVAMTEPKLKRVNARGFDVFGRAGTSPQLGHDDEVRARLRLTDKS